jgi:hypothetical protein
MGVARSLHLVVRVGVSGRPSSVAEVERHAGRPEEIKPGSPELAGLNYLHLAYY